MTRLGLKYWLLQIVWAVGGSLLSMVKLLLMPVTTVPSCSNMSPQGVLCGFAISSVSCVVQWVLCPLDDHLISLSVIQLSPDVCPRCTLQGCFDILYCIITCPWTFLLIHSLINVVHVNEYLANWYKYKNSHFYEQTSKLHSVRLSSPSEGWLDIQVNFGPPVPNYHLLLTHPVTRRSTRRMQTSLAKADHHPHIARCMKGCQSDW